MAQNDYVIGIGMGLDPSGLKAGLETAKQDIALAKSEFEAAAGWDKAWNNSIDGVQAKIKQLADEVEAKKQMVDLWQNELDRVTEIYGDDSAEAKQTQIKLNNAQAALNKAESYAKSLQDRLEELQSQEEDTGDATDDLTDDIDDLGDEADDTQKGGLKKLKDSLVDIKGSVADKVKQGLANIKEKFADLASKGIGKAVDMLKDFIRGVVNVGKDFTSTMSMVRANSGASAAEMEELEKVAKDMGASTTFSAVEAADALNYMALAGWDAKQSADALGGILDLAAAAQMDLGDASDMVTDYLGAFGLKAKDAGHFADVLAYAQSHANTTAAGLGEAYENVAATMGTAGQSVETTTALLMAMANQGTKGSRAGTALNAVMRDLTKKQKDGQVMIGETAVSIQDEAGNYRDLITILYDVKKATQGMGTAEAQSALMTTFTSDSVKAVNEVFTEGVVAVGQYRNELKKSDGAAKTISDIMNDNLSGDMKMLDSAVQDIQIGIFELIEGPLRTIVQLVTAAIKGIKWLAETIYNGLVLLYDHSIGPIIDTLGATWDLLTGNFEGADEFFGGVADGIKGAFEGADQFFDEVGQKAMAALESGWETVSGFFGNVWDGIKGAFSGAKDWFAEQATKQVEAVKSAWSAVKGFFGNVWDGIKDAFGGAKDWFAQQANSQINALKGAWNTVSGFFGGIWDGIKSAFSDPVGWFRSQAENQVNAIKGAWNTVSGFFGGIWDSIKGAFPNVGSWFSNAFSGAFDAITKPFAGIKSFFEGIWNGIKSIFQPVLNFFGLGGSASAQTATVAYHPHMDEEAATSAVSNINNIPQAITKAFSSVTSIITKPFTDAWNWIKDTFGSIGTWLAENIINGLKDAFKNMGNVIFKPVEDFCDGVVGAFKDFFGIRSPSTVMRDQIGLMIGAGVAEGITDSIGAVERASAELSGAVAVGGSASAGGSAGGGTVVFNQTINSPDPLSAGQIYRDTRSLLGRRGWAA